MFSLDNQSLYMVVIIYKNWEFFIIQ
jgi:hypothetical protein